MGRYGGAMCVCVEGRVIRVGRLAELDTIILKKNEVLMKTNIKWTKL